MEQLPREQKGEINQQSVFAEQLAAIDRDPSLRDQLIDDGIEAAVAADRTVDDWVVRHIAQALSDQPGPSLDVLAQTGEIAAELREELRQDYEQQSAQRRRWIDSVEAYAANRADTGPVADWTERTMPPDRLIELEVRLQPLPELGDIPRPPWGRSAESGYDWMERLPRGWHVEPSWGRDGWDLGAWPLVAVALFIDEERGRYAVATYTEGDVTVQRYASRGALYVAVNEIAEFHWRLGQSRGPKDLPEGSGLLAKHCGPFSEDRLRREKAAEQRARQSRSPRGADDE